MVAYDFDSVLRKWTKTCSRCETTILGTEDENESYAIFTTEFHDGYTGVDGLASACKKCAALKTHFHRGMNRVVAERMLISQNGRCAICGEEISLVIGVDNKANVDHCHETDSTRGLLCTPCNQGLGRFKDSISIMEKAIEYLRRYKNAT
jgi:hypothetical protein